MLVFGPTKRKQKWGCSLTTQYDHDRTVKYRGQPYGSEFFQRIKRASAIEQKAIPCRHRCARAVTGHRDITGSGAQFISRFAPTASGANGAKKSAVSADSIFIDTGKQLGRIYYFTRARAPTRAVVFVCFHGIAFYSHGLYTPRFIPPISSSVLLNGRYILRRSDNVWKVRSVECEPAFRPTWY